MMSELGFVYFLERTEDRNVLRVYRIGARTSRLCSRQFMHHKIVPYSLLLRIASWDRGFRRDGGNRTYVERVQVRWAWCAPERLHRARKQLPRLLLELQQIGRAQLVEDAP